MGKQRGFSRERVILGGVARGKLAAGCGKMMWERCEADLVLSHPPERIKSLGRWVGREITHLNDKYLRGPGWRGDFSWQVLGADSFPQQDPARSRGKGTGRCWIHPGARSLLWELARGGLGTHRTGSVTSPGSQVTLASPVSSPLPLFK